MGNPTGNPQSKRFSITKRQKLMAQIWQYHFVKKWNAREVAQALDIAWSTARAYIQIIKRSRLNQIEKNEPDFYGLNGWIASTVEVYDQIIKEAWNEYAKSVTPKERMVCLDRVKDAEKTKFDVMQSMGVAPKATEKERLNEKVIYHSKLKGDDKPTKTEITIEKTTTSEAKVENL